MSPQDKEMYRMQQDALRRVWQMQEQARRTVGTTPPAETPAPKVKEPAPPEKKTPPPKRYSRSKKPLAQAAAKPGDLIGLLTGGDSERSLILVLLLLLINEKADTYLVLSMLYLLM